MDCKWKPALMAVVVLWAPLAVRAGAWRPLQPIPCEYPATVYDFVVDTAGTPWVTARGRLFWHDGREWVQAVDGDRPVGSGQCVGRIFGGPDRGAYLSQKPAHDTQGWLLKLEAGRVQKVAGFQVDAYHVHPGVYVARSGELFNFTGGFLAVWQGEWNTIETAMGFTRDLVSIVDFGPRGPVVFVPWNRARAAIWDGRRFHTEVALPEFPVDNFGNVKMCRWGRERILFWHVLSGVLGAAKIAGSRLEPVDVAGLAEQLGPKRKVYAADTAPDGSLWMRVTNRKLRYPNLVRIDAQGKATWHRAGWMMWGSRPPECYDKSVLHDRRGTSWFWFGLHNGGIGSISGGRVNVDNWEDGLRAPNVRHLRQSPDGTLYAATTSAAWPVYRYDPQGTPDRRLTKRWEEVGHVISRETVSDPSGNLWVPRLDRPGRVSRWDGTAWRDFEVPFDTDKMDRLLADDRGRLIAEVHAHVKQDGAYVIGGPRPSHHATLQQAVGYCVDTGARRFRASGFYVLPPLVTEDGQIWLALGDGNRSKELFVRTDGAWRKTRLQDVSAMGLDERKRPVFVDGRVVWAYQSGEFVELSRVPDLQPRSKLTVYGEYERSSDVPFIRGMPKSLRQRLTVMRQVKSYYRAPIRWQEAESLDRAEPLDGVEVAELTARLRHLWINDPRRAIPAPGGGAWIWNMGETTFRWLDDVLVGLNPEGTPLVDRRWWQVGVTATGGVWVITRDDPGNWSIFLRKAGPARSPPAVRPKQCEVEHGRRVRVTWEVPDEDVTALVWRTNLDDRWRLFDGEPYHRSFTEPGKRELRFEIRAMDELGLLGPAAWHTVELDVRLPRTRFSAELPECLEDLVWVVPVGADWTGADVPCRIEWRVDGREWRPLPADRRLAVAAYNNRAVEFQFRAVEEDVFIDPQPLCVKLRVEMALEEVVRPRIEQILFGTEAERDQAIEDLKAAPDVSRRLLSEKLGSLREAQDNCRKALKSLENGMQKQDSAGPVSSPPGLLWCLLQTGYTPAAELQLQ